MSRVGKLPIKIPDAVSVLLLQGMVIVRGPKGELSKSLPASIKVVQDNHMLCVISDTMLLNAKKNYGTYRCLLNNMVKGVTEGFEKRLELQGVGYKAHMIENVLILGLGYSHSLKVLPLKGVTFSVEGNIVVVSGLDKNLVGQAAANIRVLRSPEPYKGKGVRYCGERVRRKIGKAGKK